mmetsp:Transcript_18281/g.30037  ORF Transcript_18281/g.30037 Transcript_18281/m.30037 type:complete len:221 (-) Transcript_18281:151-813(-)
MAFVSGAVLSLSRATSFTVQSTEFCDTNTRPQNGTRFKIGKAAFVGTTQSFSCRRREETVIYRQFRVSANLAERSFIAVKPDGVQRGVVGEIITRFEKKGYKLVGLKAVVPSKSLAEEHYAALKEKPFFGALVGFITSGPVIAMVWEGKGVVATARKLIGATNPLASEPGTIRGDFAVDVGRNVIHGSDSVENGEREIGLWFKPEEIVCWDPEQTKWIYE